MAEIKDKVVTVESLSALHTHNKETYITKVNPTGSGSLSVNRKADTIIGDNSVALGFNVEASGDYSYAEGFGTISEGNTSHSQGLETKASANACHVEGYGTIGSSDFSHVQGRFNIEDAEDKYAHIVGNGTSDASRSNAHTVDWEGNGWFAGNFSADGNILLTSNQYGDELPEAGIKGRIFFKRLTDV